MSFFQSANSHFHGRWMRSIQTDGMDFGFLVSASRKTDHVYGSYVRVGTTLYTVRTRPFIEHNIVSLIRTKFQIPLSLDR